MLTFFKLSSIYIAIIAFVETQLGGHGVLGNVLAESTALKISAYYLIMAHLTITMMSLSFHRYHTHKGIIINKYVDAFMNVWLWMVTGMARRDWVSIHLYHHAHSDKDKDPHSPVKKGFWRVFLFGAVDYAKAKNNPEVVRIKNNIEASKMDLFFEKHSFLGLGILSAFSIAGLGVAWGSLFSVLHFTISPLFAVGGVNALAHTWGYRNHDSKDNSRNIGFLVPLNFIICGELDHNNHHAVPRSSSFRHKWYEFDIGYVYIKVLEFFGLVEVKNAYTTTSLKADLAKEFQKQFQALMEENAEFKKKLEQMARELNTTYQELIAQIKAYLAGKKIELEAPVKEFAAEVKRIIKTNYRLNLSYS